MVSCSNDDVVSIAPRKAITFGNVFIENSTRAAEFHTKDNLGEFFVYGTVTGSGNTVNLYKGATVTKTDDVWDCNVTQYWVPECSYDFVAISDVTATDPSTTTDGAVVVKTDANGMPKEIIYNASSQKDLLYAKIENPIETGLDAVPTTGIDDNGNVKFTFNHLLSKVMFTFTNGFGEETGVELTVKDIKITNAAKTSTYTCSTGAWTSTSFFTGNDTDYLYFGNTSAIAPAASGTNDSNCLLIPETNKEFSISFTINHNKGGQPTPKIITTNPITLEPGHFYNFTAELNVGNVTGVVPITFNINKHEWTNEEDDYEVGPLYPEN